MKSVIITGADRGLGLSLAKEYLARDYIVFAGKYLKDYALLEKLREENSRLHIINLDVEKEKSIAAAAHSVSQVTNGKLDALISNAAFMDYTQTVNCAFREPDMDVMSAWKSFSANALGAFRMVNAFLPLLDKGNGKLLCFVSSEVSCINLMKKRPGSSLPYPMSKTSMNMAVRLMHNDLYPQGYKFRLFHPGWMKRVMPDGSRSEYALYDPDFTAAVAIKYFETARRDEQRLAMVDFRGYEWPF